MTAVGLSHVGTEQPTLLAQAARGEAARSHLPHLACVSMQPAVRQALAASERAAGQPGMGLAAWQCFAQGVVQCMLLTPVREPAGCACHCCRAWAV